MYFSDDNGGTEWGDGDTECGCGDTNGVRGDMKCTCLALRIRSHSCVMHLRVVISASLTLITARWAITRSSASAEVACEGVPLTDMYQAGF